MGIVSRSRGQALVETALVLPILLLLMALSLDVGRAFLSSVGVHNLSRIGADYAAAHPQETDWGPTSRYQRLMMRDAELIGCADGSVAIAPPAFSPSPPTFGGDVTVTVSCDFVLITPIATNIIGTVADVSGSSTFPVFGMCPDCGPAPPIDPPAPAPEDSPCNRAPDMANLSVGGARLAWELAGFTGAFTPGPGPDDGYTVLGEPSLSDLPDDDDCLPHSTTATVSYTAIDPATCVDDALVPDLRGMRVSAARTVWTDAGFQDANFLPSTAPADQLVDVVLPSPPEALPGQCADPLATTVTVTTEAAPAPETQYCTVPDFHLTLTANAQATWDAAGFGGAVAYLGSPPYEIRYQSLVALSYEDCDAPITVGPSPLEAP